jgi:hypothetical protein
MATSAYLVAFARTVLVLAPLLVVSRVVRTRLSTARGALAALLECALALSLLLVASELLGLVGLLRLGWLLAALWLSAALAVVLWRAPSAGEKNGLRPDRHTDKHIAGGMWPALVVVSLMLGQWVFSTANVIGGGMLSFDVLWYHMPFAAVFAQTASVTHVQFTQADPFVAYYPANSELFHAIGLIAFGNDFLSPLINLGWMALALLAGWCAGRRWRVEWWTLAVAALLLSLPVLSLTQPGEAFNDIVGLAALLAAVALILAPEAGGLELASAGLALGLAVGTKYTFLVPAAAVVVGVAVTSPSAARLRRGIILGAGVLLTGGWWYLRAAIHTGNPLGIQQTLGPLHLPGTYSPLANAQSQSVFSELTHLALWGSRFIPGLAGAFGPLWPVLLLGVTAPVIACWFLKTEPLLRVIAVVAVLAGASYVFLPTGATGIQQGVTLFQVNLRYLTPALVLGLLLLPIYLAIRTPSRLRWLGPTIVAVALLAQLERGVWPTQPVRHAAFLVGVAAALIGASAVRARLSTAGRKTVLTAAVVAAVALVAVGDLAQHHYFDRRYLVAQRGSGIGAIYRWAQTVSHTRIATYGTFKQYPLYGATDTNTVHYLGQPAGDGGYEPINSCSRWRRSLQSGDYRFLVLTPAPTAAIPLAWSRQDPALTPILHPAPADWVFAVAYKPASANCD